jgi:hypothetical protein
MIKGWVAINPNTAHDTVFVFSWQITYTYVPPSSVLPVTHATYLLTASVCCIHIQV